MTDARELNNENQVLVVRAVEEGHQALLTCETLVDEQVLFLVTDVHGLATPARPLEFVGHDPTKVLIVDGIVLAEGGSIVIIDHGLVAMPGKVTTEVLDEYPYLTLELDVEGFDDIQSAVVGLTGDNLVDIGIVVHADTDGRVRLNILVGPGVEPCEFIIITESIEVLNIVGIGLVAIAYLLA